MAIRYGFLLLAAALIDPPGSLRSQEKPRTAAELLDMQWSRGKAEGQGPVKLTTFPLRLEDIGQMRPMGMTASGHVTPSDHLYLIPREPKDKGQKYDVLAVADGRIVVVQWRPNPKGGQPDPTVFDRAVDLRVVIEHSATCWSYVDHLVELDPAVRKAIDVELKPGQPVPVRVPVKAGQVIGKVGYQTFDFALIDTAVARKGFVRPEQFLARHPWVLHTVDPFDYVAEPLRGKLLELNPRKVEPFGGRIDYDVDGRLVGNWYREGTGGFAGLNRRIDYWVGHLAIVPHYIDPTRVVISLGDFEGKPRQFQVKGNAPDPAKVSAADGVVKYELIRPGTDDRTGKPLVGARDEVQGVLLVQVLKDRKLRVEVFPGKAAGDVTGFTMVAWIYER